MSWRGVASTEQGSVARPRLCYGRVMNTQKIGAGVVLVIGSLALGCGGKAIGIEEENGGSGASSGAGGSSGTGTGGSSSAGGDPGSGGNSGSAGVGGGSGGTSASGGDGGSIVASDGDSTVTTCTFPPTSANACVLCKGDWYCSWQLNHEQPIPTCPVNITLNQKGCTIGCVQCLDGGSIAVQWGCTEDMYIFPTTNGLSCAY
jgi:hypothetical protein